MLGRTPRPVKGGPLVTYSIISCRVSLKFSPGQALISQIEPKPANKEPSTAWDSFMHNLEVALDAPAVAEHIFDVGPPGTMSVEQAVDMLVTPNILVHIWNLARATGLNEQIDEHLGAQRIAGMEPMDAARRRSWCRGRSSGDDFGLCGSSSL